jgi:cellulose synthase/poly-beta-1,6-N-acetylglucosamine synthase-like glycosyltransferase
MVTTGELKHSLLEAFERLDLLSLAGAAAGSFYWGKPLMCSGANLAYSRTLYEETRMFEPVSGIASGDDMFLMIGARKLGKKLSYLKSRDALVQTHPAVTLGSLIRQRSRWAAKTPYYHQGDIEAVALLTLLAHLSVILMPWLLIRDPSNWPWVVAAIIAKGAADFALLHIIAGYTAQRRYLRIFIPVFLLYHPYQMLILIGSLFKKSPWKGRN